jgi:hypothetical protein
MLKTLQSPSIIVVVRDNVGSCVAPSILIRSSMDRQHLIWHHFYSLFRIRLEGADSLVGVGVNACSGSGVVQLMDVHSFKC